MLPFENRLPAERRWGVGRRCRGRVSDGLSPGKHAFATVVPAGPAWCCTPLAPAPGGCPDRSRSTCESALFVHMVLSAGWKPPPVRHDCLTRIKWRERMQMVLSASTFNREEVMRKFIVASLAAAGLVASATVSMAQTVVGVSWNNFQEERWKTDEAAIKAALDAAGAKYISTDAQSSASKQLTDVENLISQGANALIILAQDQDAIQPAVAKAIDEGIPVIAYDRLFENPQAFYITFDNKEVGVLEAQAVYDAQPKGNYVIIKGNSADPNADFLRDGHRRGHRPGGEERRHQDRRRDLHRQLGSGQRPEGDGAVPDPQQQQGRRRRFRERRHGRRRCRGACCAGTGRSGPGLRSGRRPRGAEPRCARHADRVGLEGLRASSARRQAKRPWRLPRASPWTRSQARSCSMVAPRASTCTRCS